MSQPLISIVVPMLDGEEFVDIFYQSVYEQTWAEWELIVVDGGSSDRGPDRIRAIAKTDSRVRFYSQAGDINRGIAAARNLGVSKARAEYLSFLDCDNTWEKTKLEEQIDALHIRRVQLVYGPEKVEVEQGLDLGELNGQQFVMTPGYHEAGSLLTGWITGEETHPQASDTLMTRRAFDTVGGFIPDFYPEEYTEEVAWACISGTLFPFYVIDKPLVIHYIHKGSCTAKAIRRGIANANAERVRMWLSGWFAGRGLSGPRAICSAPHLLR